MRIVLVQHRRVRARKREPSSGSLVLRCCYRLVRCHTHHMPMHQNAAAMDSHSMSFGSHSASCIGFMWIVLSCVRLGTVTVASFGRRINVRVLAIIGSIAYSVPWRNVHRV